MYGLIQSVISQTDVTMDDITEEYKEYFWCQSVQQRNSVDGKEER